MKSTRLHPACLLLLLAATTTTVSSAEDAGIVKDLTTGTETTHTGAQLHAGLPVKLEAGVEKRLSIRR